MDGSFSSPPLFTMNARTPGLSQMCSTSHLLQGNIAALRMKNKHHDPLLQVYIQLLSENQKGQREAGHRTP